MNQIVKVGLLLVLVNFDFCVSFYEKQGTCPKIQSMEEFDMKRFLGKWYIIQGTKPAADDAVIGCTTLTYAEIESDRFTSTQLPQNWTSVIRMPDPENRSNLLIKLNDEAEAVFHVLATDYDNYASFMICRDLEGDKQRRAAAILSRKPNLDDNYYQFMREHLSKYSMKDEDFVPIIKCD
jgi:lipocalin